MVLDKVLVVGVPLIAPGVVLNVSPVEAKGAVVAVAG